MARCVLRFIGAGLVLLTIGMLNPAVPQKLGGVLRQYIADSPASMSIHEETTVVAERPMMAVMNNLVMFDQHVKQNSLASIVPDLATDWAWDEDGTRLTFQLRRGDVAGVDRRHARGEQGEKRRLRPLQRKRHLVIAVGRHFGKVRVPGFPWVDAQLLGGLPLQ